MSPLHDSFDGAYRGKRVLVTGHTGFKGAWLTLWLLELGADICGYSRDIPTTPSLFEAAGLAGRIRHEIGDIRDTSHFQSVIASFKPDFVFHLAAQAIVSQSYQDPVETVSTNVVGTASVMQALRGVRHPCAVMIVTSDKCYDNVEQPWGYREIDPMGGKDVYSASKGATEIIAHSFHKSFFSAPDSPVRVATGRAGNVLGGGDWAADRIVADCIRAWMSGTIVQLRRPDATRPWQHVLEPLSGYLAVTAKLTTAAKLNGESYNFGPRAEQNRTVVELLSDLARIWGFDAGHQAYEALPTPPFPEAGLLKLSCDKALMDLAWEANFSYAECVELTGEWYRDVLKGGAAAYDVTLRQIHTYDQRARTRGRAWAGVARP